MQKNLMIIIIGVIVVSCSKTLKIDLCKKTTKNKCFSCHAPFRRLEGMPLDSMYNLYGEKKLRVSLKKEFVKGQFNEKPHPKLVLSKKDIEEVICYLKHYRDGIHR